MVSVNTQMPMFRHCNNHLDVHILGTVAVPTFVIQYNYHYICFALYWTIVTKQTFVFGPDT